jgi:hypothetical protein
LLERLNADGAFDLANPRDYHMDAILECNAPFYGEVVTLYAPLGCYRIHDSNIYAMNAIENARFAMKRRTFELKVDYLARRCQRWGIPFDAAAARNGSIWLQECRMAAAKVTGDPADEPTFITLYRAVKACLNSRLPLVNKILKIVWLVSIAASPRALAKWLIAIRFIPSRRPPWFEPMLIKVLSVATRSSRAVQTGPGQGH